MLISIIIPVYNSGVLLKKNLENLLLSDYNVEIIIINDGSTDDSANICNALNSKYKNVKVFHQENQGVSSARNKGIFFSSGKYLMFLDSDDFLDKDAIEYLLNILKINSPDILAFGYQRIYNDGHIDKNKLLFNEQVYFNTKERIKKGILPFVKNNEIPMFSCLFKREITINNNIKFEKYLQYSEDYLFLLDNIIFCNGFLYIPKYFYNYYIGLNISSKNYRGIINHVCKEPECNFIHERLKLLEIYDEKKSGIDELTSLHVGIMHLYFNEKIKYITNDVIKKLDNLKKIKFKINNCPIKLKILLYLLLNKHFFLYFSILNFIKKRG